MEVLLEDQAQTLIYGVLEILFAELNLCVAAAAVFRPYSMLFSRISINSWIFVFFNPLTRLRRDHHVFLFFLVIVKILPEIQLFGCDSLVFQYF